MKYWRNGKQYEIPAPSTEELAQMENERRKWEVEQKRRPLTTEEVTSMIITQQVNTLPVDDNTALRMKYFYPAFDFIVGQKVKQGFKFTYDDKLWSVAQPELTIQAHYLPGTGTESMYTEVCESHAGTLDDPISYSGNMALQNGLYYIQNGEIYWCFRSTEIPVYSELEVLVGLYVEVTV